MKPWGYLVTFDPDEEDCALAAVVLRADDAQQLLRLWEAAQWNAEGRLPQDVQVRIEWHEVTWYAREGDRCHDR